MDIGLTIPIRGPLATRERIETLVRRADGMGRPVSRRRSAALSRSRIAADAALFAANMLVLTPRGGTYAAEEYERWLLEAGYGAVEYEPVAGRSSHLIFARSTG